MFGSLHVQLQYFIAPMCLFPSYMHVHMHSYVKPSPVVPVWVLDNGATVGGASDNVIFGHIWKCLRCVTNSASRVGLYHRRLARD